MIENSYDTIIVGGGIAGLTASAYLARDGQKVLLIEKNKELGGLVNSFSRDGFHFDDGVRALEDAGIILPMLKDLDIELEMMKSPVSLCIENEILHIENLDSLAKYKNLLITLYPGSESEINEVVKTIRKIMKHMYVLYGIDNPALMDFAKNKKYLFKELLPWLFRFMLTRRKINKLSQPVEDYLKKWLYSN